MYSQIVSDSKYHDQMFVNTTIYHLGSKVVESNIESLKSVNTFYIIGVGGEVRS